MENERRKGTVFVSVDKTKETLTLKDPMRNKRKILKYKLRAYNRVFDVIQK